MIRYPHTLFQPSNEANIGAGREPKPGCPKCLGRGFYYFVDWAQTCHCKRYAPLLPAAR